MDSASDYGSEGWGFESLRGHFKIKGLQRKSCNPFLCDQKCDQYSTKRKIVRKQILPYNAAKLCSESKVNLCIFMIVKEDKAGISFED